MKDFKVSVIIPVYNAEKYVEEAVNSALKLDEVGEIILIEDGSPDNAFEICKRLENEHEKIHVLQHEKGKNKGAGASRNLGIRRSKFDYIAFLDADDLYLPNRFKVDAEIFCNDNEIDLVFNNSGRVNSKDLSYSSIEFKKIINISQNNVLLGLLRGELIFHTNCITLNKKLIHKAGYFKESLKLHQDTHLWYKLAHFGSIYPGNLKEPVALTRDHDERRIYKRNNQSKKDFLKAVLEDFKKFEKVDKRFMKAVINRYLMSKSKNKLWLGLNSVSFFMKNPLLLKNYI
ncbi:MAG: glycosyltransferase family 2 protein [Bacteroidota bacterium]